MHGQISVVWKSNSVLRALCAADFASLAPHLQAVDVQRDQRLEQRGRGCEFVYFIESGIACTLADDPKHGVEVGMTGREGFTGVPALLDARSSPYDVRMLTAGSAHRAPVAALKEAMRQSAELDRAVRAYVLRFMVQAMRQAQVNACVPLEPRLARWLLLMHDRTDGDELQLTHERLAALLGVRRAGVSVAAKKMEHAGLIVLHRGSILVRDRSRLEEASAGAYSSVDRGEQLCERASGVTWTGEVLSRAQRATNMEWV